MSSGPSIVCLKRLSPSGTKSLKNVSKSFLTTEEVPKQEEKSVEKNEYKDGGATFKNTNGR